MLFHFKVTSYVNPIDLYRKNKVAQNMSWTANPEALEQLKDIFRGTLLSDNRERGLAYEALEQAKQQPEAENYMLEILVADSSARSDIRAAAGTNLKNSILRSTSHQDRTYILNNIMKGLTVEDSKVRNITGNVIAALFSIYKIDGWPQALPQLIQLLNTASSSDYLTQEATVSALAKICEDNASYLDQEFNGERPVTFIISTLSNTCGNPHSERLRALSIHCINQFIPLMTQSFLVHLDSFLQILFQLATDSSLEVRKNICTAFLMILETRPDKLSPHLDGVINYCLHLMQDDDEEVALEACEFLLAFSTSSIMKSDKDFVHDKLKVILPVLLSKMVYSEEEIFLMQIADEKDDMNEEDKDEDMKPISAKNRAMHSVSSQKPSSKGADAYDSDSDFDDEEDEDDLEVDQWTLRMCSASTLDILSLNFPKEVLTVALPVLQENIVSPEWPIREAAILAFGAISKSCMELSSDKLPTLVPFLVDRLQDDEPRVRQITCWTLSRYVSWVVEEAYEEGRYASYFQPTFQSIIHCTLDSKKVVQKAACSALSSFIEEADGSLLEYFLDLLLDLFIKCFEIYKRKNLIILYDCVQTFVEHMGYEKLSSKPQYIEKLLPPLLHKWQILDNNDNGLWPLLECMASVAATLKDLFAPYAVPVYERAIVILSNCISLDQQCQTNPSIEAPEKDFMVTSLDLIDGLIQGFEQHSVDLIKQNDTDLVKLLLMCFEDYTDDVRQSAYALLGDLAIFVLDATISPHLQQILVCIGHEINNRTYSSYPVCNNAIWALGEIYLRLPEGKGASFLPNLVDLLIPVLNSSDTQQAVLENAAICIGRMGLNGGATFLASKMSEFIIQWCSHMIYIVENEEKETAFKGMLNIINANPDNGFGGLSNQQGKRNLATFIECIGNYYHPPDDLRNLFGQLLTSYKSLLGDDIWMYQVMNNVTPETREFIAQTYGI